MITEGEAAAIIGFPDNRLPKESQGHQLANRAFRYLNAVQDQLSHEEHLDTFLALVAAVQKMRPEWVCQGPYSIAEGVKVFVGPNSYMILFNPNGNIHLGRYAASRPSPEWIPDYRLAITLDELVTRMKI